MTESIIRSRTNPLVKRLRALKERGAGSDLALLEGFTLVEEGLAAGLQIVEAAVTPAAEETPRGRDLLHQLSGAARVPRVALHPKPCPRRRRARASSRWRGGRSSTRTRATRRRPS
jgi:hypothetical protein